MRALIWKEFRLCWPILLVGCVLLAAPYSILLIDNEYRSHESYIVEVILAAALASTAVAMLTLTLLGGHAIAGERVDHSVEFLAYLPVSRWGNMISKLVWPAVMPLLVIGVNATVVYLTVSNSAVPELRVDSTNWLVIVEPIAVVWALGFSVAWLASSVLRSPTFAVACGLMSPILVGYVVYKFLWTFFVSGLRSGDVSVNVTFVWVGLTVASVCFVAGCFHYLRRVEP